jgi:hypothetical protein
MSDDEFREAIKEQARRDFEEGRFQTGTEFDTLKDDFVSVASPDRRSVITSAFTTHGRLFNKLRLIDQPFNQPRQQTPIHFSHVFERSHRHISSIQLTNYGWDFTKTQAEGQRGLDFRLLYNEAWYAIRNEARAAGRQFDSQGWFVLPKSSPPGNQLQTTPPSAQQIASCYEQMLSEQ